MTNIIVQNNGKTIAVNPRNLNFVVAGAALNISESPAKTANISIATTVLPFSFISYGALQISSSSITIGCVTNLSAYAQMTWGSSSVINNVTEVFPSSMSQAIVINGLSAGTTYMFQITCNTVVPVDSSGKIITGIMSFTTINSALELSPDSFSNLFNWYKGGDINTGDGTFGNTGDTNEYWSDVIAHGSINSNIKSISYPDIPLLLNGHYIFQNLNTSFLGKVLSTIQWTPLTQETSPYWLTTFTLITAIKCNGSNSGGLLHWTGNYGSSRGFFKVVYDSINIIVTIGDDFGHVFSITQAIDMFTTFKIFAITFDYNNKLLSLMVDGHITVISTPGFSGTFVAYTSALGTTILNPDLYIYDTPPTYFACADMVLYSDIKPKSIIDMISRYMVNRYALSYISLL